MADHELQCPASGRSRAISVATSLAHEYVSKRESIPRIANKYGLPRSAVRYALIISGVELRPRADAARLASVGRPSPLKGAKRPPFSQEWKENIGVGRREWGASNARGLSQKPNGYLEYTRGENKGRAQHVVVMEARIGRRLLPDEHVHHIDGDRTNNNENNLALVTRSGHARLHRIEDALAGKKRERDENGRLR